MTLRIMLLFALAGLCATPGFGDCVEDCGTDFGYCLAAAYVVEGACISEAIYESEEDYVNCLQFSGPDFYLCIELSDIDYENNIQHCNDYVFQPAIDACYDQLPFCLLNCA